MNKRGSLRRSRGIGRIAPLFQNEKRRRPVKPSRVEMGETEMLSEPAGERTLARGRGTVYRDHERANRHAALSNRAPEPIYQGKEAGKTCRDRRRVINAYRLSGRQAKDQECHRDPMV